MQGCTSLRSGPLQWASIATCSNSKTMSLSHLCISLSVEARTLCGCGKSLVEARKFQVSWQIETLKWLGPSISSVGARVQWMNPQLQGNKNLQPADNGACWQGSIFQHQQGGLVSRMPCLWSRPLCSVYKLSQV